MHQSIKITIAALGSAALLAVASWNLALAAEDSAQYKTYRASNFGFSIELPALGELLDPTSQEWENEPEVAFEWYSPQDDPATADVSESGPVTLVQGRVDDLGAEIDEATFGVFTASLLENWRADPDKYAVTTENKTMSIGGRVWNLIEIADSSSPEAKVYYSVFSTYKGSKIFTISMYYLSPLSKDVQDFGKPIIQSFKPE